MCIEYEDEWERLKNFIIGLSRSANPSEMRPIRNIQEWMKEREDSYSENQETYDEKHLRHQGNET
jgi:predicted HicB family RNase H-like nuclease